MTLSACGKFSVVIHANCLLSDVIFPGLGVVEFTLRYQKLDSRLDVMLETAQVRSNYEYVNFEKLKKRRKEIRREDTAKNGEKKERKRKERKGK